MLEMKTYAGDILHVYNKSIAGYGIFKDLNNSQRFLDVLDYNNTFKPHRSFSNFLDTNPNYKCSGLLYHKNSSLVKFISYCIMPDHYHLILKVLSDNVLSKYISDVQNSFTKHFNFKFDRKGPLWQSCYQFVKIKTNEQLIHVVRYVHLNPTTAYLVEHPEDWQFSSYNFFITKLKCLNYANEVSIQDPFYFKKFTEDQINYQRKLKLIKKLIFD